MELRLGPREDWTQNPLGPGSYNANVNCVHPRAKGGDWARSSSERTSLQVSAAENDMPYAEGDVRIIMRAKEQFAFASKVPRFSSERRKRRPLTETAELIQDAPTDSLILNRSVEPAMELLPGPGQYLETSQLCTVGERDSRSFPREERFRNARNTVVGPGEYANPAQVEISERYKHRRSSAFVSKTKRMFDGVVAAFCGSGIEVSSCWRNQ